MTVVTRFAPSPTGYLHIGGARTALFNWLYAKHTGGKFLLRIEDTDRARSTQGAIDAILDGLKWMGLHWDGEPVFQFSRAAKHREAAETLLAQGNAYKCFATPEELTAMREAQKAKGQSIRYDGRWRNRDPKEAPPGAPYVIRLKAPQDGDTVINDLVQGTVTVANAQLDDMVLLRADGTPTYMLAVVVDDIDMGITHVIRGDDHLNNAFRQYQLITALGHAAPAYAHIPLIHGADGAKLSKRHGALGVEAYRDMGFLPEALRNYLVRLGWSHGDDEIFSDEQAIAWFDIKDVNRGASRFDMDKLANLNGHYIRKADDHYLAEQVTPLVQRKLGHNLEHQQKLWLLNSMADLKQRAKSLIELAESAARYIESPKDYSPVIAAFASTLPVTFSSNVHSLTASTAWTSSNEPDPKAIEEWARRYAAENKMKLGDLMLQYRAALTGATVSPSVFNMFKVLGKEETEKRLGQAQHYVVINPAPPKANS